MTDFPNAAASAEDAGTDDQRTEPAQPQLPAPDEPAVVREQFQARIDELTQERDQARRELDQALQNLELARCVQPRAVGAGLGSAAAWPIVARAQQPGMPVPPPIPYSAFCHSDQIRIQSENRQGTRPYHSGNAVSDCRTRGSSERRMFITACLRAPRRCPGTLGIRS
jgi:hypothetical protein